MINLHAENNCRRWRIKGESLSYCGLLIAPIPYPHPISGQISGLA